ncbi:hypothetical protein ABTA49_12770 [Acinetobacter baumannii]|uniref:hypothetical protein n=1 Tax=Acinetobacter baumannii TaxID=470 RepID=UPI001DF0A1B4|nr:hypothetical protein [Acinetobacter baumannii]EHU2483438.1 hypothetical protein [Acinetobacter baumannii]
MNTICLISNYSRLLATDIEELESIYEGRDIASPTKGLDYNYAKYGKTQSQEDILGEELDSLLLSYTDDQPNKIQFNGVITVNSQTPIESIHIAFSKLKRNLVDLTNIANYNKDTLKELGIGSPKACLDFIDVEFETSNPQHRSHIKKYLTEHTKSKKHPKGIKHFIRTIHESNDVLENEEKNNATDNVGTKFVIRLHDVENSKALQKRLNFLKHYNPDLVIENLKLVAVERAIDISNAPIEMLIALYKAVKLDEDASNFRMAQKKPERMMTDHGKDITHLKTKYPNAVSHLRGSKHFNNNADIFSLSDYLAALTPIASSDHRTFEYTGHTLYINPKEAVYILRLYYKTTDRDEILPFEEWRVRFEERYLDYALSSLIGKSQVTVKDLPELINAMSRKLKLYKLKDDADKYFQFIYRAIPAPYAQEKQFVHGINGRAKKRVDKSGNVNALGKNLEPHSEFNRMIKEEQHNLAKKFKTKN